MSIMVMVAWQCDLCGHVWLARGPDPPALCARCRKRRWFTGKWDGKVELGDQEGVKIADVEGGSLKIVMVEGVGMAVVKVGPPAEAHKPARLSREKKAAAKLDEAMPDAAIKDMLVRRRARAWAEGDEGAAAAFEQAITKLKSEPPAMPEELDLRKKLLILKQWWRAAFDSHRLSGEARSEAIRTFFQRTLAPHQYTQVTSALFHHAPPPEPPEWEPIIYLLQCKAARCIEEHDTHMEQVYREAADRLEQDFKNGVSASQVHKPKKKAAKAEARNQANALAKLKSKAGDA